MSITSDVYDYCKKALKTAPAGLSSIKICEHFEGTYTPSQVRGGLETNCAAGKLRKIPGSHDVKIPGVAPVNFTLPGLALTAHLPDVKNAKPAIMARKNPKAPEAPPPKKAEVQQKNRDYVREEVRARLPIEWRKNRREFTRYITARLSLDPRVALNVIYGQLKRGELIAIGTGKGELLAEWLGNGQHKFKDTDGDILTLVSCNPAMSADAIQARVGISRKGDALEGRNRLEMMVSAGLLHWSADRQRYQLTPAEAAAPAEAPEAPTIEQAAPEAPAPAPEPARPATGLLAALEAQIQSLAHTIAESLAAQITENLRRNLASLESAQPMPVFRPVGFEAPAALTHEKRHALRVAVAGLLPQQAGQIASEFPAVEFTFIESDRIGEKIETQIRQADAVYAMVKFISHALDGRLKHHGNFHRINGGLSSLRTLLRGELSKATQ